MEADKFSSICVFCCKTFKDGEEFSPTSPNGDGRYNKNPLSRFLLVFQRHLSIKKSLPEMLKMLEFDSAAGNSNKQQIHTCSLCSIILSSFCDIYYQKEILNLQLQWKLQTLVRLMTLAGRVTSRIKILKRIFDGEADGNLRKFMDFRKELIRLGSQKMSRSLPRVRLDSLSPLHQPHNKVSLKTSPSSLKRSNRQLIKSDEEEKTDSKSQLQCWIMSFAAVVSLLSTFNESEKTNSATEELPAITLDELITEDFDEATNDLSNDNDDVSMEDACDNEVDSVVNFENNTIDPEQKITSSLGSDGLHEKTEFFEQDNDRQVHSDPIDIKHHFELEEQESNGVVASKRKGKSSVNKQMIKKLFSCSYCRNKYVRKATLTQHVKIKHPEKRIKENSKRNGPIFCKVCNIGYATYRYYITHTKRIDHRRKVKRQTRDQHNQVIAKKPRRVNASKRKRFVSKANSTPSRKQSISRITTAIEAVNCKSETTKPGYNLRTRKKQAPKEIMTDNSEDDGDCASSSSDDEYSLDDYSSTSSNSTCSDAKSDDNDDPMLPVVTVKKEKKVIHSERQQQRREKQYQTWQNNCRKFREPGNYKCNFCFAVETNAFKISMHEIRQHSEIPPPQGQTRTGLHQCPRCPYQVQTRFHYIKHFARVHLNIKLEGDSICPICHVEVQRDNDKHFKRAHDVSGMDPNEIIKCSEKGCTVEFSSKPWLYRHRREYHKTDPMFWSSDDDDDDDEDNNDRQKAGSTIACKFCDKTFIDENRLERHKYYFHNKRGNNGEIIKSIQNTYICPNKKCSKNYKRKEILDKHIKLHGNFQCQVCDLVMDYAPDLPMHELEHFPVNTSKTHSFKCSRCPVFKFQFKGVYITHFLEAHLGITDKLYECSVCKLQFKKSAGRYHFSSHHKTEGVDPNEIKRCNNCPAYFLLSEQLQKHQLSNCAESESNNVQSSSSSSLIKSRHFCTFPECTESFRSLEEVEAHKKLHGQFKCSFCNFEANYAANLALHEMEHAVRTTENRKTFNCSRCSYSSATANSFKIHFIEKHLCLDPKVVICVVCKARYVRKDGLRDHFTINHKIKGVDASTIERCDLCPAYFLKRIQLVIHKRKQHQRQNIFECKECTKTFSSDKKLNVHFLRAHKGISSSISAIPCDIPGCKKIFANEDDMILHKRFGHHNQPEKGKRKKKIERKLFPCDKCGREFKGVGGLKNHTKQMHHKDRPTDFKCDQCSKVFNTKIGLQNHQEFHKGPEEWKFMCEVCSKKCVTKDALKAHMNTHTKAKPFVCQICGEKYAHRHNLRNHVNTKHKDEGVEDIPKKVNRKYFVSRKGKKLGTGFCFTWDDGQKSSNANPI